MYTSSHSLVVCTHARINALEVLVIGLCSSEVVESKNISSILCDRHAERTGNGAGTQVRHMRARAHLGGGLVRRADRTV